MKNLKTHPLRAERRRHALTQQQLADFTQVSLSTIERAEHGESIRADNQRRICDYLKKTPEELGLVNEESINQDEQNSTNTNNTLYTTTPIQSTTRTYLPPTRFLTMKPEELIKRYADENEYLLKLKTEDINWTLPQVIVFDNSQAHLPLSAIRVEVDTSVPIYSIPTKLEGKATDILEELEPYFHDSTTIRLNEIHQTEQVLTLIVSKANYLQYIATNYAMDALLTEKGWTRSLRDTVHPTTRLCTLEESLLANHIGIGTLVFTIDNYLIIPIRSKENVGIWRQEVSPSISGATNYDDDMYSTKSGPLSTWMREGREELGIDNNDFIEESSIFLGITRELLRGGKPEMFFATQLHITRAKLEQKFNKARDKWENMKLEWLEFTNPLTPPTIRQEHSLLLQDLSRMLHQYQTRLAPPMKANLALWLRYMCSFQTT